MLNQFLDTRIYGKIALISPWNDFCSIPLGKCVFKARVINRCKKFKFWNFWERPLFEIWEYAFNVTIRCTLQWFILKQRMQNLLLLNPQCDVPMHCAVKVQCSAASQLSCSTFFSILSSNIMAKYFQYIYRSELNIVPYSIIIPPPNFQQKSEILKISDNNPTSKFWVTACQFQTSVRQICSTKFSNWIENLENSHWNNHIVYQKPNAVQSSGNYPTPCFANVDPSMIGESLSCCYCLKNLINKLLIYERNPWIISLHRMSHHKVNKFE